MQEVYVKELERNTEMLCQLFDEAVVDKKVETASFCLSALIAQAAGNQRVGMCRYPSRRVVLNGLRRPVWFDQECRDKRSFLLKLLFLVRLCMLALTFKRRF